MNAFTHGEKLLCENRLVSQGSMGIFLRVGDEEGMGTVEFSRGSLILTWCCVYGSSGTVGSFSRGLTSKAGRDLATSDYDCDAWPQGMEAWQST